MKARDIFLVLGFVMFLSGVMFVPYRPFADPSEVPRVSWLASYIVLFLVFGGLVMLAIWADQGMKSVEGLAEKED